MCASESEPPLSPERLQELRQLDVYEKTQKELLAWGQRRFWGFALILGLGGYGLVQATLSSAEKTIITAQLETENARQAAAQAITQTSAAMEAVARLQALADAAKLAIKESQDQMDAARAVSIELESALEQLRIVRLTTIDELEDLRKRIKDTSTEVQARLGGVLARVEALGHIVDPSNKSLEVLLANIAVGSTSDKAKAARALGETRNDRPDVVDALKAMFRSPTRDDFPATSAAARSLWIILGEQALPFFEEALATSAEGNHASFVDMSIGDVFFDQRTVSSRLALFLEKWSARSDMILAVSIALLTWSPEFETDDALKSLVRVASFACEREDFLAAHATLALQSVAKDRSKYSRRLRSVLAEIARPSLERALSSKDERTKTYARAALSAFDE